MAAPFYDLIRKNDESCWLKLKNEFILYFVDTKQVAQISQSSGEETFLFLDKRKMSKVNFFDILNQKKIWLGRNNFDFFSNDNHRKMILSLMWCVVTCCEVFEFDLSEPFLEKGFQDPWLTGCVDGRFDCFRFFESLWLWERVDPLVMLLAGELLSSPPLLPGEYL